jgi:hypothetical protein
MDKKTIINSFKAQDIELHPAGIWKFDSNGKKEPIVAFRLDGLSIDSYPKDNMFKFRIDNTPYMVIDVDGGNIASLYKELPSLANTLTTTTTREDKFHIYIVRPEEFPITRIVNALPQIDLLSNGIVFEGHLYDINETYDIENDKIVKLTPQEVDYLLSLVPVGVKSLTTKIANKRFVPWEKQLIDDYIKGTIKDDRKLWKALTPKSEQKQGKTNYTRPDLSYDTFNRMAFYLALNEYIPHEMVIKFLEKVLVQEYNVNLNSKETQQRLYKQIIPTLPIYEVDDYNDSFDNHIAKAPISRDDRFKVVRTIDSSGNPKYVLLDKYTHIPQSINNTILRAQKAVQYLYPTLDADTWTYGLPEVELTSNPYLPQKSYDFDRHVFTLSTLKPTQYLLECGELDTKPHNILTKAIENIFKMTKDTTSSVNPEDFYYHWLAHVIFSQKPMSTIFSLSTDSTVQGGTGKSTFTAKLPMHILPRGTVFTIDEGTASWGDAFYNSKLTCFDDLHDTDKWSKLYTTMKRETSGTIQKKNIKGGATVDTDVSAGLSVSSNFLPKIDETDRRFFIWSPTQKLSQEEGIEIARIMSDFNKYHQEIQDIVSYCKYLYNNYKDKYTRELYIEAPRTSFNNTAKVGGATSEKLISMILNSPDVLFDSFVPNKKNQMSNVEIVEFILNQISEPTSKSNGKSLVYLPQDFFKILLNATRDEDMMNLSPRKISFLLGCTFNSITANMQSYREKYPDWATRGLRLNIEEDTIAKYRNWLKYNKPETKEVKEQSEIDL